MSVDQLALVVQVFRKAVLVASFQDRSVKRQVEPLMDLFTVVFCVAR